jgi:DNA-binding NtrC family response regulator
MSAATIFRCYGTFQPPHQRRLRASAQNLHPRRHQSALQEYNWTGNIRELANVMERLFILCDQTVREEDVRQYVFPK